MKNQFIRLEDEQKEEFLKLFYDRFAGRLEFYAIRKEKGEDRAAYVPSDHETVKKEVRGIGTPQFTEAVVKAHLEGKQLIGAYCINSDSNVNWFAFDFDGKNGDPWEAAIDQAQVLRDEAGLDVYVERSQSGNGYHVWGFFNAPVHAGRVRHALSPFIEDVAVFDRMYPVQDGVNEAQPKGNLIALPLAGSRVENGNSVFVKRGSDGQPEVITDQIGFLRKVKLIDPSVIDVLFEKAGTYTPQRDITSFDGETESLGRSWKLTHPVFGCDFWRQGWDNPEEINEPLWYAMACNLAQLQDGRELFHAWSARDLRYSARHTDKKYDQALRQNKPHGCESIRAIGGKCTCDLRFPGKAWHPFDIVKIKTSELIESVELDEARASQGIEDGMDEVIEWLEQVVRDPTIGRGLPTAIPELRKHFGYRAGELTVIAARNSIGKTAYALHEGLFLAKGGHASVKFFSLEMTRRQVWTRVASPLTGITQTRMSEGLLTPEDFNKLRQAQRLCREYDFHVDDTTAHMDSIIESAAEFVLSRQAEGKRVVIILDYLQIVPRHPRESEQDALARVVQQAKQFAKALNCHVIALCQMNRNADESTSQSKTFDSFVRGSDVINYVADNIQMVLGEKGPGVVERGFIQHKQRNGTAGISLTFEFNQPYMLWGAEGTWGATIVDPTERDDDDPTPKVVETDDGFVDTETGELLPEQFQATNFAAFNAAHDDLLDGL